MPLSGTVIQGKWSRQQFLLERALGAGANGEVHLVRTPNGRAAMKIGQRAGDIALEWGLLQKLSTTNAVFPKPMLMDDEDGGLGRYFYIMEWIPGKTLDEELSHMSAAVFDQVVEQIVHALDDLHQTGHAFCDMKPQNIIVCSNPALTIRFVDVGGVSAFGRSVRQFTPAYDRAFWDIGTRRADPWYDLCGLVLLSVCGNAKTPRNLSSLPPAERKKWLNGALQGYPRAEYRPLFSAVLEGDIIDCPRFLRALGKVRAQSQTTHIHVPVAGSPAMRRKRRDWTEWLMWTALATACMTAFAAWGTLLGWF